MAELVLLWSAFGCTVLLAVKRRDRVGLPWVGMGLAVVGILTMVLHSSRRQIESFLVSPANLDAAADDARWQMIELLGLILVGAGVVVMSLVADRERRSRKIESQLKSIAPQLHGSGEVLKSVLGAAPGAWLLIAPMRGREGEFEVVHADDRAGAILTAPTNGSCTLSDFQPLSLVRAIASAVTSSDCEKGAARTECSARDRWYEVSAGVHGDGVIVLVDDITARKETEIRLQQAAFADPVTGLANRALLERQIGAHLERARSDDQYQFAVLWLDFDDFKSVNDRYGHAVGDELLRSIGSRIRATLDRSCATDHSEYLATRWGGDEFVIILGRVDQAQTERVAERLRAALAAPHRMGNVEVRSTASIGVTTSRGDHATGDEMLKIADEAMYQAKRESKNAVRFHSGPVLATIEPDQEPTPETRARAA